MKLALISLAKEDSAGTGPVGLIPLFDTNIVSNQVEIARKLGSDRIILLSPTMQGALLQYADALKHQGIEAEIARSARDLAQYASAEDEILFLGDGILPGERLNSELSVGNAELIFVVANDDKYSEFERIDLNHRWLGIATLKASRLSALTEIPDDWDIGSALLRTAVQAGCQRELISDPKMTEGALFHLQSTEIASQHARQKLASAKPRKSNFLDRFAIWPLTRIALPRLWKSPESRNYLNILSILSAVIALIAAYFQWPVTALILLFLGAIGQKFRRSISIFSQRILSRDVIKIAFSGLAALTLAILVFGYSDRSNIWPNMVVLVLMLGILVRTQISSPGSRLSLIKPDRPLILLILAIATSFGGFLPGLYAASLLCLLYLLTGSDYSDENAENAGGSAS